MQRKLSALDKSMLLLFFSSLSASNSNGRTTARYLSSFYAYMTTSRMLNMSQVLWKMQMPLFSFESNLLSFHLSFLSLYLVSSISILALVFPHPLQKPITQLWALSKQQQYIQEMSPFYPTRTRTHHLTTFTRPLPAAVTYSLSVPDQVTVSVPACSM